jgi:hypothetical protein
VRATSAPSPAPIATPPAPHPQEHDQDPLELAVDLGKRPGHLHRPAAWDALREDAQMDEVVLVHVGQVAPRACRRDLSRAFLHREASGRSGTAQRAAVRKQDLHGALRPAEGLGPRRRQPARLARGAGPESRPAPIEEPDDHVGALAQRLVHLATQLPAHAEVHGRRGCDHRERHGQPGGGRDAGAQRHGSRST